MRCAVIGSTKGREFFEMLAQQRCNPLAPIRTAVGLIARLIDLRHANQRNIGGYRQVP